MGYLSPLVTENTILLRDSNVAASYEVGTQKANNNGLEELKSHLSMIDYGIFDAAYEAQDRIR